MGPVGRTGPRSFRQDVFVAEELGKAVTQALSAWDANCYQVGKPIEGWSASRSPFCCPVATGSTAEGCQSVLQSFLATGAQPKDNAIHHPVDQSMNRCFVEPTTGGDSDNAVHGGETREPEMFRIAGHHVTRSLAVLEDRRRMRQRLPARLQQRRRSVRVVRRLEHPSRKCLVAERERYVRVGEAFQSRVEAAIRVGDCSAQVRAQPFEATLRQGVQQGAPVGEVALRGRMADPEFAPELPERETVDAARFDQSLRRLQ